MRIVTICRPLLGGVYSVVLSLRRALDERGVDLTWVAAGRTLSRDILETATKEELAFGAVSRMRSSFRTAERGKT
jgi:hypothetical protein